MGYPLKRMKRLWRLGPALLLVVVLASGCTSFGRAWKQSAELAPGPDGIAGCWDGQWLSDVNGHRGRLRAVATPVGEHEYDVRYRATYRGLFRFHYHMRMKVEPGSEGACAFDGEADLGIWGTYRCRGSADGSEFRAAYWTRFDEGTFTLHRPELP